MHRDLEQRAERRLPELVVSLFAVLLVGLVVAGTGMQPAEGPGRVPRTVALTSGAKPPPTTAAEQIDSADRVARGRLPAEAAPVPLPTPPAVVAAEPVERWLPSGTGMWLHDWTASENGHALEVVARAQRAGLTHLYVQTGSSKKGWIGQTVLSQLMPVVAGSGLDVIAWDFPKLDDPEADARRLARAAWWNRSGAAMVTAVAPDIETAAEGTRIDAERVRRYYTALRAALPARTAILATVPWPSEKRVGKYPYAETAPFADAFVPMAYWYNRSPTTVTMTSMDYLARFGKPVMPVGQGYDGRLDAPYLAADPAPDKSVEAFSFAARARGARSISLWSWQTTGDLQWQVLTEASRFFGPVAVAATTASPAAVPSVAPVVPGQGRTLAPGRRSHRAPSAPPSPSP